MALEIEELLESDIRLIDWSIDWLIGVIWQCFSYIKGE